MMETSLRFTREQFNTVSSFLAADLDGTATVVECGMSQLESPFSKMIRCVKNIKGAFRFNELASNCPDEGTQYCVFVRRLPDKEIIARIGNSLWAIVDGESISAFSWNGSSLSQVDSVMVADYDLNLFFAPSVVDSDSEFTRRTAQAFGFGTTDLLSHLTVGIAGASGTGSIVAEQLFRLGVKRLVIIDDDCVEDCNLGRILNSKKPDAVGRVKKVSMLKRCYEECGFPTETIALDSVILDPNVVKILAQCDVIFGCLDSSDGRAQLNRISTFYCIPYFDVGVSLKADSKGGVSEVNYAVRYVLPGASSLLSRGSIHQHRIDADAMKRENPTMYAERLKEKYITGANESSPAVISVNMAAASMAINDFLARVHPYRIEPNSTYETVWMDFVTMRIIKEAPTATDEDLKRHLGAGDVQPLLKMPSLGRV